MSDTPTTQRWVATRRSAGEAAGAFLGLTLRRRTWWAFVVGIEMMLALLVMGAIEERYGTVTRLVWGFVYALVPTLAFVGLILGAGFLLNRRLFRRRLWDGAVIEAAVGEHHLMLRGPWAETTLSFDGIASVRSSGDWVLLKQVGSPVWGVWPAALFPHDDLGRLTRSLAVRQKGAYDARGNVSRTS